MFMPNVCREHDQPRPAGNSGRFNRKRPSMLSEFHGSKYHTHNMREGDRDGLVYRDFFSHVFVFNMVPTYDC